MNQTQLLLITLILIRGFDLSGWWVLWAVLIWIFTPDASVTLTKK